MLAVSYPEVGRTAMNWGYISAFFWTTVVMNCVQPVNWEACLPVQDWLFPAIGDYIRFKSEEPLCLRKTGLTIHQWNGWSLNSLEEEVDARTQYQGN